MQVKPLDRNMVDSDLGIVNAARVSLHKESFELNTADFKLLQYLHTHKHFTPFTHASMIFSVEWFHEREALYFYKNRNPAGFQHIESSDKTLGHRPYDAIKGSLFSWTQNLHTVNIHLKDYIFSRLITKYPETMKVMFPGKEDCPFNYFHGGCEIMYDYAKARGLEDLIPITLYIKVPIAIARQIRTSQIGFAYSGIYVEGEAFAYNEVSRRYVNDTPEFYRVKEWRVREDNSIKQGSTGIAPISTKDVLVGMQEANIQYALDDYVDGVSRQVAPEQLRFLMPQSMYTEFWMTGTIKRWKQFIELREKNDVQQETRDFVSLVKEVLVTP